MMIEATGRLVMVGLSHAEAPLSLLERVGLIVRHFDAPRTAWLALTPKGQMSGDPGLRRFLETAYLPQGQSTRRDIGVLAEQIEIAPDTLERMMLGWQERGWIGQFLAATVTER